MKNSSPKKVDQDLAQIADLQKELELKQTQLLRALADYQNLERRTQIQMDSEKQNFLFGFFRDLIEIKNDLDTAAAFNQDSGLKLIRSKLEQFFAKHQISEFNPEGAQFNPEQMECVQTISGETDQQVTKVLEKGYLYKTVLIRPAKVVVSKLEVSPRGE